MILKPATREAVRYACLRFHYAHRLPSGGLIAWSVYDGPGDGTWCGTVAFARGASPFYASTFGHGLVNGQVVELVRMALNGKQSSTTKVLGVSLRLLRKAAPTVRLVISFADTAQGHRGTIYQATNWVCMGLRPLEKYYRIHGELVHPRTVMTNMERFIAAGTVADKSLASVRVAYGDKMATRDDVLLPKIKYGFALDPKLKPVLESMRRPIPDVACGRRLDSEAPGHQPGQDGANPIRPL